VRGLFADIPSGSAVAGNTGRPPSVAGRFTAVNKGGIRRPWIRDESDYSNLELLIFTVAVPMGKFTVKTVTPNNWFRASAAA